MLEFDDFIYWNSDVIAYCEGIHSDSYCIDWDDNASSDDDDDESDE